jgi:hypothetical protein
MYFITRTSPQPGLSQDRSGGAPRHIATQFPAAGHHNAARLGRVSKHHMAASLALGVPTVSLQHSDEVTILHPMLPAL